MFSAKKRKLEQENQLLRGRLDSLYTPGFEAKTYRVSVLNVLVMAAAGLLTAAATVFGPAMLREDKAMLREDKLGIATSWDFSQYVGVTSDTMPRAGHDYDPENFKDPDLEAFHEGVLLISLTAQKDRNYVFTDIRVEPTESDLPEPQWYFIPPPSAGSGPSTNNVELSLALDTQSWSNLDPSVELQPGIKFHPFSLTSESPATVRIWVSGTKSSAFSIIVSYQTGGDNNIIEKTVGEFIIYGDDESTPHFTTEQSKYIEMTK